MNPITIFQAWRAWTKVKKEYQMKGKKTVLTMGVALAVALYQHFVGPIPAVDPELWNIVLPIVAIGLRAVTKTPMFKGT